MSGRVFLVGAGPGDADLLTVRAVRLLSEADVVLYDRLISPDVLSCISPLAEQICVGKEHGRQAETQSRIFRLMLQHAMAGHNVVRLKGGDPSVFGRLAEEWLFLSGLGIPVEVVPGISSCIAASELAGVPLTARGIAKSFAVITGHGAGYGETDWSGYAAIDTLVILMGVSQRVAIAKALIAAGRRSSEPVMFVTSATTEQETITVATLGAVAADEVEVVSPSVFVIGDVVRLRSRIAAQAEAMAS